MFFDDCERNRLDSYTEKCIMGTMKIQRDAELATVVEILANELEMCAQHMKAIDPSLYVDGLYEIAKEARVNSAIRSLIVTMAPQE